MTKQRRRDGLLLDLRFAVRMFYQRRGVVSVTIVGLSLAIAVCTVAFGLVQAILLISWDVPDPSTFVEVERLVANGRSSSMFYESRFRELADAVESVELQAWFDERAPFGDTNQEEVGVGVVTGGLFETIGIDAAVGRVLTEEDDDSARPPAAVLTYGFWRDRFGGDESLVGQTVRLMGQPFSVVGVLHEGFTGFPRQGIPAIWIPVAFRDQIWRRQSAREPILLVVGRLVEGTTREQAEQEVSAVTAALGSQWATKEEPLTVGARLRGVEGILSGPGAGTIRWVLGVIATILGVVLLLACTNVANLLLANAMSRRREIGARLALGASHARIIRQLLTESVLLGAVSGALALLLAYWLLHASGALLGLPWTNPVSLDAGSFAFAVVFTLIAAIGAGLAPARYGARGDLATPLKGAGGWLESGRPNRMRAALVATQAAAAMVLLVLAVLLARAVAHATDYDFGLEVDRLVTLEQTLDAAGYDPVAASEYWRQALQRVGQLPGVESAAIVSYPPFGGSYGRTTRFNRDGREYRVYFNYTSSSYFSTTGMRLLRGRSYTDAEVSSGAPVAVVTERLARRLWNGDDPLGATLGVLAEDLSETRVIGIVDNSPMRLDFEADVLYRPVVQTMGAGTVVRAHLIARARGDAETIVRPLHEAISAMDPNTVPRTTPLRAAMAERFLQVRLNVIVAAMLGVVAFALACIGVFCLTAFSVEQRKGEIGVRLALGARFGDIVRMTLRDSLRPVIAGLVVGLLIAIAGSRVLIAVLYGVSPYDPVAFGAAALVLVLAAASAAGLAARRIGAVDPVITLERG